MSIKTSRDRTQHYAPNRASRQDNKLHLWNSGCAHKLIFRVKYKYLLFKQKLAIYETKVLAVHSKSKTAKSFIHKSFDVGTLMSHLIELILLHFVYIRFNRKYR